MALRLALAPARAAGRSLGGSAADSVVAWLRAQGDVGFEVRRTLLGRARTIAAGPEGRRGIAVDPGTGEVPRDRWEAHEGDRAPRVMGAPRGGSGSRRRSSRT